MKTYNLLYTSKESLETFYRLNCLDENKKYLIRVHTSEHTSETIIPVIEELMSVFPKAYIVGTSAYAVICQGEVIEKGCIISVTEFEKSEIDVFYHEYDDDDKYAVIDKLSGYLKNNKTSLILTFHSNFGEIQKNLDSLKKVSPKTIVVGGVAAVSEEQSCLPFVFYGNKVSENSSKRLGNGYLILLVTLTSCGCGGCGGNKTLTYDNAAAEIKKTPFSIRKMVFFNI